MDQEETPRQDPDLDIVVIFPIERPYERIRVSDRLDALRGMPCGKRVSRLDEPSEITWQTLQDARRLDQEQLKALREKFDESLDESDEKSDRVSHKFDEKSDRVNHRFDAADDNLRVLHKTLIIVFIILCGIGVAGTAIIATLLIALSGGK